MKLYLSVLFVISFAGNPFNAFGQQDKTVVGISFGHPIPNKEITYEEHTYDSESKWERQFGFRLGIYAQWYVSSCLAMQLEIDYQKINLYQEYKSLKYPQDNYSTKRDESSTGYYFNVIYAITKWNKFRLTPWVFAGIGAKFSPFVLTSKVGGGILYSLSPSMSVLAGFYLGPDTLVHADPFTFRIFPFDIRYAALSIGLEYKL
ncbi:MAG: hypothetical protein QHH14_00210 [Clostridiales bacterium]|jgi:hypothetical protein|nr:hypothetical protein [Clostridiales bacterium]